ncbi:MAG: glycosyltransferase family 2 protein [Synergistales bacterium]|nr:glycosyltransferase family 2 protein [Synergistales bacterium]
MSFPGSISIVVPLYNEEENVRELYSRISRVMKKMDLPFEIIFINDGSTDRTWKHIQEISTQDISVRGMSFRRNYGQTAAMSAGIEASRGEVIITLDGDLQNDPSDIPLLLEKIREGYDVVSGWRKNRQDALVSRKIPSRIANWLIGKMTGVELHDYGCSLKAYRSEVIKEVDLYGELHRFIPALASMVGARVTEIPVNHYARTRGTSKYGISRTPKVFLDLLLVRFLLRYRTRPIHFLGGAGLGMGLTGFLIAFYLTLKKIFMGEELSRRPLLLFAVILILFGTQLVTTGFLAELVIRTYYESQDKKPYWVKEMIEGGLEN